MSQRPKQVLSPKNKISLLLIIFTIVSKSKSATLSETSLSCKPAGSIILPTSNALISTCSASGNTISYFSLKSDQTGVNGLAQVSFEWNQPVLQALVSGQNVLISKANSYQIWTSKIIESPIFSLDPKVILTGTSGTNSELAKVICSSSSSLCFSGEGPNSLSPGKHAYKVDTLVLGNIDTYPDPSSPIDGFVLMSILPNSSFIVTTSSLTDFKLFIWDSSSTSTSYITTPESSIPSSEPQVTNLKSLAASSLQNKALVIGSSTLIIDGSTSRFLQKIDLTEMEREDQFIYDTDTPSDLTLMDDTYFGIVLLSDKKMGLFSHKFMINFKFQTAIAGDDLVSLTWIMGTNYYVTSDAAAPRLILNKIDNNQPCHSSCLECTTNKIFMDSNVCSSCSLNYVQGPSPTVCDCPVTTGHALINNSCKKCDSDCKTCGPDSITQCTSCDSPKFLLTSEEKCLLECPSSFYPDDSSNTCLSCYQNCNKCSGGAENECSECQLNKVLFQGQCLDECPSSQGYVDNQGICILKDQCLYNFYNKEDGSCKKCPEECTTCQYSRNTQTIQCTSRYLNFVKAYFENSKIYLQFDDKLSLKHTDQLRINFEDSLITANISSIKLVNQNTTIEISAQFNNNEIKSQPAVVSLNNQDVLFSNDNFKIFGDFPIKILIRYPTPSSLINSEDVRIIQKISKYLSYATLLTFLIGFLCFPMTNSNNLKILFTIKYLGLIESHSSYYLYEFFGNLDYSMVNIYEYLGVENGVERGCSLQERDIQNRMGCNALVNGNFELLIFAALFGIKMMLWLVMKFKKPTLKNKGASLQSGPRKSLNLNEVTDKNIDKKKQKIKKKDKKIENNIELATDDLQISRFTKFVQNYNSFYLYPLFFGLSNKIMVSLAYNVRELFVKIDIFVIFSTFYQLCFSIYFIYQIYSHIHYYTRLRIILKYTPKASASKVINILISKQSLLSKSLLWFYRSDRFNSISLNLGIELFQQCISSYILVYMSTLPLPQIGILIIIQGYQAIQYSISCPMVTFEANFHKLLNNWIIFIIMILLAFNQLSYSIMDSQIRQIIFERPVLIISMTILIFNIMFSLYQVTEVFQNGFKARKFMKGSMEYSYVKNEIGENEFNELSTQKNPIKGEEVLSDIFTDKIRKQKMKIKKKVANKKQQPVGFLNRKKMKKMKIKLSK